MLNWQLKTFDELTANELYHILQLRCEVFIVEQNCPYLDPDGKDFKSHHLLGSINGTLVAYARLVKPGVSYSEVSIGRVVTSPLYRRGGYGIELMNEAIRQIECIYGKVPIRIGAQTYIKKFYESFGFADLNEPYMEDGIPHLIMLRR